MRTFGLSALAGFGILVSCGNLPLWAQASLPGELRTNGKDVEAAFESQRQVLQRSSAVIYDGYKNIVYGVVMSPDGWILTKASEIDGKEDLAVRVDGKKWDEVKVEAVSSVWDLALLKIDAEGLTPVRWAESSDLAQGSWVISNGSASRSRLRVSIGIVSAKSREVDGGSPVVMGVALEEVEGGLRIAQVSKDTGAERAGLKKDDLIVEFEGVAVLKRENLIDRVRLFTPGDVVKLGVVRDGEKMEAELELMARHEAFAEQKSRNDMMSGRFSKRRTSFPMVLQTDLMLSDRTVGGPLLNFKGEAIGMNIARANRAESFAIPVEDLKKVYAKLRERASGN